MSVTVQEVARVIGRIHDLPMTERMIIKYRFGLWSGKLMSYEQVSELVGLPMAEVRRVESAVLKRLTDSVGADSLLVEPRGNGALGALLYETVIKAAAAASVEAADVIRLDFHPREGKAWVVTVGPVENIVIEVGQISDDGEAG